MPSETVCCFDRHVRCRGRHCERATDAGDGSSAGCCSYVRHHDHVCICGDDAGADGRSLADDEAAAPLLCRLLHGRAAVSYPLTYIRHESATFNILHGRAARCVYSAVDVLPRKVPAGKVKGAESREARDICGVRVLTVPSCMCCRSLASVVMFAEAGVRTMQVSLLCTRNAAHCCFTCCNCARLIASDLVESPIAAVCMNETIICGRRR